MQNQHQHQYHNPTAMAAAAAAAGGPAAAAFFGQYPGLLILRGLVIWIGIYMQPLFILLKVRSDELFNFEVCY